MAVAPLVAENILKMVFSSKLSIRKSAFLYFGSADILLTACYVCSHKRLTQQKKQRERERKELDALGRRHLANVRVVQRNVVYVVGLGSRFAKEEVRPLIPASSDTCR